MAFPDFYDTEIIRKRIVFKGRVQRVGFRYEARLIAFNLGLSGIASNLENGNVLVELQGGQDRIDYFVHTMKNISRIIITDYTAQDIPVIDDEKSFSIIV